jgi:ketopantoate hydroxymethyltransferase
MLRRKPEEKPHEITEAICICEFRILGIGASPVRRGQVLPVHDARVKAHPEFFRELGRSMQEVNNDV